MSRAPERQRAVLFDLGNTLAAYYHASDFGPILTQAISAVRDELSRRGRCELPLEAAVTAAAVENREAADHRFMPLTDRLERIFRVSLADDPALANTLCERFLAPIFAVGRVYDDVLPALGPAAAGWNADRDRLERAMGKSSATVAPPGACSSAMIYAGTSKGAPPSASVRC